MINIVIDQPYGAAACASSHGRPLPMGDAVPAVPVVREPQLVVRQRQMAWPKSGQQGWSVFIGSHHAARKAEAHRREVVTYGATAMLNGDVWGPDPWRPHPV